MGDIPDDVKDSHDTDPGGLRRVQLLQLVDEQRAAIGMLVEWALDALPKIKAEAGAEYTLMPGAIHGIGRKFGPFQEGARWSDDPQMPVMESAALFDLLDRWAAATASIEIDEG